ncbi:MAG: 30S ribosomal protein S15 [Nanoarchaeota archaeon]
MARTHARKKGKSGSKRPVTPDFSFVTLKPKEVENLVIDMVKEDKKPSQIGLILRDTYGIPNVKQFTGKSISKIMEEKKLNLEVPEDLQSLVTKANTLKKHLESNTRDVHNKRGLQLIESKIRRLSNYYKKGGRLASNWKYN